MGTAGRRYRNTAPAGVLAWVVDSPSILALLVL
jgi:hypothetical protein